MSAPGADRGVTMAERLRLRLVTVVSPEAPLRYPAAAMPERCPRLGCGAFLKPWPDGAICSGCARVIYRIDESRPRAVNE